MHGLSVLCFFFHLLDDHRQSILRIGRAASLNRSTTDGHLHRRLERWIVSCEHGITCIDATEHDTTVHESSCDTYLLLLNIIHYTTYRKYTVRRAPGNDHPIAAINTSISEHGPRGINA